MSKFNVGDTVIYDESSYSRRGSRETTITRVGRKCVYAKTYGHETGFDKETGHEKSDYTGGNIYTLEEWTEKARRGALLLALRNHGVNFDLSRDQFSTDMLSALLNVFEENKA